MIQDCYCQPPELYPQLCAELDRSFSLLHYWGPLASVRASRWIADATLAVLARPASAPDVLLTYLPHLDYVLQRHGPLAEGAVRPALRDTTALLGQLVDAAKAAGYEVLVWGDYAIAAAHGVVFPNRRLREGGLFVPRQVGRRTYPDLQASRAFAMVDHQVAHVYVNEPADLAVAQDCCRDIEGVADIARPDRAADPESGDLVLTAAPGHWFAYPWWEKAREAPDYARHVDIHNKIGFDPCELFWGWPPPAVSLDPSRVHGTHGRADLPACAGSTLAQLCGAASLRDLALGVRDLLAAP
jgi:predicted AlkP superfamily pyrophosphatase or phosphodiesterase